MAAGRAAESGSTVLLLEKMPETGNKLLLTGNGRCNLSNNKPLKDFITMYGSNGRFLYGVFFQFFREELLDLLAGYGIKAKVETDGRIFPVSDDAGDVLQALRQYAFRENTRVLAGKKVTGIGVANGMVTGVAAGTELFPGKDKRHKSLHPGPEFLAIFTSACSANSAVKFF